MPHESLLHTLSAKSAAACDTCGEVDDVRIVRHDYGPAAIMCRHCFEQWDGENSFTDLPMVAA